MNSSQICITYYSHRGYSLLVDDSSVAWIFVQVSPELGNILKNIYAKIYYYYGS